MSDKLGDVKLVEFIHPDSIGVVVWSVYQYSLARGKYATEGQMYWKNVDPNFQPFHKKEEAIAYKNSIQKKPR